LYQLFALCSGKSLFVFQISKGIFGDELTVEEVEYWIAYGILNTANTLDIDSIGKGLDHVIEMIDDKRREKEKELERLRNKGKGKS
jgi:hypothetical protein